MRDRELGRREGFARRKGDRHGLDDLRGAGVGKAHLVYRQGDEIGKIPLAFEQDRQGARRLEDGIVAEGRVYVTTPGAGYIETPTITIVDANNTPGTGATAVVAGETSTKGGPAAARYLTKKVVLESGFDSGDLNVYLSAYRPVGTDINVYYKILNRYDTQTFDDGVWQLMTKTNSSDSSYSQTRNDIREYTYAPGTNGKEQGYVTYTGNNGQEYDNFSQFAIKIVMTTTDKTLVPFLADMRCIALPQNINTSF